MLSFSQLLLNKYLGDGTYLFTWKKVEAKQEELNETTFSLQVLIWESFRAHVCLFWLNSSVSLKLTSNLIPNGFILKW